jgi:DNA replication protein DnaC
LHSDIEPERLLHELIAAETAEREVKSLAYQMKAARFPAHRDLAGFDFTQSRVDEALIRRLHSGGFTQTAQNAVLIGGPGTGKTHSGYRHWRGSDPETRQTGAVPSPRLNWSMR